MNRSDEERKAAIKRAEEGQKKRQGQRQRAKNIKGRNPAPSRSPIKQVADANAAANAAIERMISYTGQRLEQLFHDVKSNTKNPRGGVGARKRK